MNFINKFRNYILENDFEIKVYKDKVNIVNYVNIDGIENDKIVIRYTEGLVIIKGNNLVINKLFNDEVLISGKISQVELR